MSSQPARHKHPRITFSAKSSPEQGELDDDDVARKEIDAAMDRERLQVMRSKSSTSLSRSDRAKNDRPRDTDRVTDRRGSDMRPSKNARDIANSHSRTRSPDRAARRNSQPDILRVDTRDVLRKKSPERPKLTSTVVVPPLNAKPERVVESPSLVRDRNVRDRAGSRHQEPDVRPKEPARKAVPEGTRLNDDRRRRESPERREVKREKDTLPDKSRRSPEVRPAKRSAHGERRTSRDDPPKASISRIKQEPSESRRSTQRPEPLPEKPRKKTPASPDASEDEKPPKKTKAESPVSASDEEDRTSSSVSSVEKKSHDESDESGSEVSGPVLGPPRPRFESTGSNLEEITEPVSAPTPERDAASDVAAEPDHSGLPFYLPGIQGCRSIEEFEVINRVEEGTYGVVYRARDKRTDQVVALKRLKMEKEKEGFPITSLREVSTLLKAHHKNVVKILEVIIGANMDKIYMVMEFVEHDMKALMERVPQPFLIGEVKTLMQQLLSAVGHLHDNWIIHRDLKTSNLLLSHKGILKVGDFGLAREYGSPLKPYTPVVVTLWYRCPELLLGAKEYSTAVDMWSVGCIFAEFLTLKPLFPGKSEIEQINKIFKELGNPSEDNWPEYKDLPVVKLTTFPVYPTNTLRRRFPPTVLTHSGYDLLTKLLEYNPSKRIGAEEALKHVHFTDSPLPVPPSMFPTYPAKSEQGPRGPRNKTPKPPSGGKQFKDTVDADGADGFRMALPKDTHRRKGDGLGFQLRF